VKKWIVSSCLGALLVFSIGAVLMAQNQGNGVGEFCKPLTEAFDVSNDLCVNCVNRGRDDLAVCMCKDAELFEDNPFLGYPNLGQCVKALHDAGF
jgi:hypothetical protein